MAEKALSDNGLLYFWQQIKNKFALKEKVPADVTRSQTDATFVGPDKTTPLFYLRQADTTLAGLMTVAHVNALAGKADQSALAAKADKVDFGFSDGTAHNTDNDKTQGVGIKVYNPTSGKAGTSDVVLSSTISGSQTVDTNGAKTHIPTWQGIMKWVLGKSYATAADLSDKIGSIELKDSTSTPNDSDTGQRDLYVDDVSIGTLVTSYAPGTEQRPYVAPSWRAFFQRLAEKADKSSQSIANDTAHSSENDYTQGKRITIAITGGTDYVDVVPHSIVYGSPSEENDNNQRIPTWEGLMQWVTGRGYATVSNMNTELAKKSKVTVSQPTSGDNTGTVVNVDGTNYYVVSDTYPGNSNAVDYQRAPSWHAMRTELGNKADSSALGNYINVSQKGAANGVATLDNNGIIPSSQLPSFVDDVIEVYGRSGVTSLNANAFSTSEGGSALTPSNGKIYVLMKAYTQGSGTTAVTYKQNSQFRWSGTAYVPMFDGGVSWITNAEIDTILTM